MSWPVYRIDTVEQVPSALANLRDFQDVRLTDVQETMGSAPQTICAWEKGRQEISTRSLVALLAAYGYRMVFLHPSQYETLMKRDGV